MKSYRGAPTDRWGDTPLANPVLMSAFGIGRGRMPLVAQNKKIVPHIIIVGAIETPSTLIGWLSNTAFI